MTWHPRLGCGGASNYGAALALAPSGAAAAVALTAGGGGSGAAAAGPAASVGTSGDGSGGSTGDGPRRLRRRRAASTCPRAHTISHISRAPAPAGNSQQQPPARVVAAKSDESLPADPCDAVQRLAPQTATHRTTNKQMKRICILGAGHGTSSTAWTSPHFPHAIWFASACRASGSSGGSSRAAAQKSGTPKRSMKPACNPPRVLFRRSQGGVTCPRCALTASAGNRGRGRGSGRRNRSEENCRAAPSLVHEPDSTSWGTSGCARTRGSSTWHNQKAQSVHEKAEASLSFLKYVPHAAHHESNRGRSLCCKTGPRDWGPAEAAALL
jgi:hypothetical protein